MVSFISVALPYIIIGGIFILAQIAYLIYFKGRVSNISVILSKWFNNKFIVDLLSIFVVLNVIGLPFLIYIISGIHLISEGRFEAVYVFLLFSLHTLFLGLMIWYLMKWRLSKTVKFWLLLSISLFMWYLITSISFNDFFTFSGWTAIFMSLTYVWLGIVIFEVDMMRNRVYFNNYLKIVEQAEPQADSEQIIRLTKENSK